MIVTLPWPPATLSGHAKGNWRGKSAPTKKARADAAAATLALRPQPMAADGDIRVTVIFYPPDRRGDRTNYPNRIKPYWDGIADALDVNDRRFLPAFLYAKPTADARVEFLIGGGA